MKYLWNVTYTVSYVWCQTLVTVGQWTSICSWSVGQAITNGVNSIRVLSPPLWRTLQPSRRGGGLYSTFEVARAQTLGGVRRALKIIQPKVQKMYLPQNCWTKVQHDWLKFNEMLNPSKTGLLFLWWGSSRSLDNFDWEGWWVNDTYCLSVTSSLSQNSH